jgi:hypothetical protein
MSSPAGSEFSTNTTTAEGLEKTLLESRPNKLKDTVQLLTFATV